MHRRRRVTQGLIGAIVIACATSTDSRPLRCQTASPRFAVAELPLQQQPIGLATDILDRLVTIDVHEVTRAEALTRIGRVAGVSVNFQLEQLGPTDMRVSLHAVNMTLGAALRSVLKNSSLLVRVVAKDAVVIEPPLRRSEAEERSDSNGRVLGRVADMGTRVLLAGAAVQLFSTKEMAVTGEDGRYNFRSVAPGPQMLIVRRLGYAMQRVSISVPARDSLVVNLFLTPAPSRLDEVVTTATGDASRRQIGNDIPTIDASAVVPNSPVTSISDVIESRAAGVQVLSNGGGLVGVSPQIAIRGQQEFGDNNQPLLVVDGVRIDNRSITTATSPNGPVGGGFNDLAPEQIASIEVIRGPSASALYGTDAARGVIIVKTKQGSVGRRLWNVYAEQGAATIDSHQFPLQYYGWGTVSQECVLVQVAAGECRQDSVTSFSPFRVPSLTPLGTGSQQLYGGDVSGGSAEARYFLSGSYEDAIGPLKMPVVDQASFRAERGAIGLAHDEIWPNGAQRAQGRANLVVNLGSTADVSASAAYLQKDTRIPAANVLGVIESYGPGYRDATTNGFGGDPGNVFVQHNDESGNHLTVASTVHWRPLSWLMGEMTAGVDVAATQLDAYVRNGEGFPGSLGGVTNSDENQIQYSGTAVLTATNHVSNLMTAGSSIGVQYNRTSDKVVFSSASVLAPGATSIAQGGAGTLGSDGIAEAAVAGAFVEEQLTFLDRYSVRGALRGDGATTFGSKFSYAWYPKFDASWSVSNEPFWPRNAVVSDLRLRSAYGISGTQPGPFAAVTLEHPTPATVGGVPVVGTLISTLGNPNLKPEQQRELEAGADIELARGRIQFQGTYYEKHTTDAITLFGGSASTANAQMDVNFGSLLNRGFEGTASVRLIDSRLMAWDLSFNASTNHNKVLTLAKGIASYGVFGGATLQVGYPVGAYFAHGYRYADVNHNGIIEPSELTLDTTFHFVGSAYPNSQYTASSTIAVLNRLVQIRVVVDHRGAFQILDNDQLASTAGSHLSRCRAGIWSCGPNFQVIRNKMGFLVLPQLHSPWAACR